MVAYNCNITINFFYRPKNQREGSVLTFTNPNLLPSSTTNSFECRVYIKYIMKKVCSPNPEKHRTSAFTMFNRIII